MDISCVSYDASDEIVFLVKRLKSKNDADLYVISKDLGEMKTDDFKEEGISDIFFVDKAVYQDDTIHNLQVKISSAIGESVDSIYMFHEKKITKENRNYIINTFLRSAFRKKSFMTTSRFNRLLNMFFVEGVKSVSYRTDADIIRYDQAKELLTKKKSKVLKNVHKYYQPISFDLKDSHEIDVIFAFNPFLADQMDEDDYKTSINKQSDLNNMDIGSLNKSNEIHIVCKKDYEQYVSEKIGTSKDKVIDFYFHSNIDTKSTIDKYQKLLDKIDKIKYEVNTYDYKSIVHNIDCRLVESKLMAMSTPKQYVSTKNKANTETNSVNLKKIFHLLNSSSTLPFISYKGKNGEYYYRVLKYGLQDLVSKRKYDKWITQERKYVKDRNNDSITIKTITKDNIVSSVILKESGNYDIYSNFPAIKNIPLSYLKELIDTVNDKVINKIAEFTNTDEAGVNTFHFDVNGSLLEYKTVVVITTNERLATKNSIVKRLEKNMFFSLLKEIDNNEMLLKYKRVSNYAEMDSITGFLNNHYNLPKDILIEKLMSEFNLDLDTATKEWDQRKDDVHLQMVNNNGHITVKKKYTEGIIVRLKILNHNQFEIQIQNATRADYHNNIIKSMVLTLLRDEKVNFNLDENSRKILEQITDNNIDGNNSGNNFTMALLHNLNKPLEDTNKDEDRDDNDDDDDNSSIISADSLDMSSISPINDFINDDNDDEVIPNESTINQPMSLTSSNSVLQQPTALNEDGDEEDDKTMNELKKEFTNVDMDDKMMKRYHTKFINDRLKNADSDLFVKGYSKHCGAVDKKQPVVLTKSEKARVDSHNRNAYTGYIKTGSTEELKKRNYYICPLIWCPISKIAMTPDELKKNGNLCPKPNEETPLILHNKKDTEKKALGDYKKYPYLMKQNLHPSEKEMVCCGYKPNSNVKYDDTEDDDKKNNNNDKDDDVSDDNLDDDLKNENSNRYIRKMVGLPVETDRLASLPLSLNNVLNPGKTIEMCSGLRNDSKNDCFIRLGLGLNIKNRFLNALVKTLNNPKVKSVKELTELINDELSLHEYMMINNGNTMKTYVPYSFDDNAMYKKYRKYVKSAKGQIYIRSLNLYDIFEFVNENDTINVKDEMYKRIKRELTMFASLEKFKEYMLDESIEKDVDEMYGLTKLHFLNPNKLAYIILDTTDEDDISILCQKYSLTDIDNSSKCVVLLKKSVYYELLVRNRSCCTIDTLKEPLSVKEDGVRELLNLYRSNCNFVGSKSKLIANDVYIKLLELQRVDLFKCNEKINTPGRDIIIVLNYNVRVIGFLIKTTGFYIPLENEEYITRFLFDEICTTSNSAVYMDDMSLLISEKVCKKKKIYERTLSELKSVDMFYDDLLKDDKKIDLHMNIVEEINEEMLNLFIGYVTDDARIDFMNDYECMEQNKLDLTQKIIKKLDENIMIRKRIELIRHDLNPYPEEERLQQMKEILEYIVDIIDNKKDVNEKLLNIITTEFYNKGITVLEQMMYANPVIDMNTEILYTLRDLLSDTMYDHYLLSENPYKELKNSIEDMVIDYKVLNLRSDDILSDEQFTFLKVTPDDIYNSKKLHPLMMATILNKSNAKDAFITVFEKINHEVYQNKKVALTEDYVIKNHIDLVKKYYNTNENKKLIRYWMNILNQNDVKIKNKENSITITDSKNKLDAYIYYVKDEEDISNVMINKNYKWGLLELSFMCNAYSLGLIVVSRTKVNPAKITDVEIRDNMELILPAKKNIKTATYLLVFLTKNKDLSSPFYFLLKSREKRYEQLVYSWNDLTPTMQDILQREKTDKMEIFDKMYP